MSSSTCIDTARRLTPGAVLPQRYSSCSPGSSSSIVNLVRVAIGAPGAVTNGTTLYSDRQRRRVTSHGTGSIAFVSGSASTKRANVYAPSSVRYVPSPNPRRNRVPNALPAKAATSHTQPCRLPEAMPLKYAPMLQPYASRAP
jgi:hypothetical protein